MQTRVLLVDDEPDFVELITYGLQVNGFECTSAGNGMDGLQQARRLRPDAVILDVMLPDLDGFTICEMLRSHPSTSKSAVLMLTCLAGTLTRLNGIASGADDYLVKPLRTPSLVERIRWAIRHRLELPSHQDQDWCASNAAPIQGVTASFSFAEATLGLRT